jgi:DNA-directed RNA polymerase specialized sigma24 family protein
VHEAFEKLALAHPLHVELVKPCYFAGLNNEEAAQVLGISVSTATNY